LKSAILEDLSLESKAAYAMTMALAWKHQPYLDGTVVKELVAALDSAITNQVANPPAAKGAAAGPAAAVAAAKPKRRKKKKPAAAGAGDAAAVAGADGEEGGEEEA
jgi:hypothetical protein